jgi:mono/diheme cytochrome c family protein
MKKHFVSTLGILLLIVMAGTFLVACGTSSPASGNATTGAGLMQERCTACHSSTRVVSAHHTAAEWKVSVDRMIARGAQLTPQEEQTLINYLAQNYP